MRHSPFARSFAGPITLVLDSTIRGTPNADELTGGPGADVIFGRAGADRILGLGGGDTILGGAGNDTIFGDGETGPPPTLPGRPVPDVLPGDDLILGYGGGGDDVLIGGTGDDVLIGGYGVDLLIGGPGADRFAFRFYDPFRTAPDTGVGEGNRDIILDFGPGDVIDLSGYKALGGNVPEPVFLGTDPFRATGGLQVRYEVVDGRTVVQFHAPRGGAPDVPTAPTGEIELIGAYALTATDFIL